MTGGRTLLCFVVAVAAVVAYPDIEASVGQDEGRSQVLLVDDPGIGGVEETVLEEDDSKVGSYLSVFGWMGSGVPWMR